MNQLRHFVFAGLVLAWGCAKDLPRFPELITTIDPIDIDTLQVTTTISGYIGNVAIKEAGVLWGYDELQLTLDDPGVQHIATPDPRAETFTTVISDLLFDTLVYIRSYAVIDQDGDNTVYSGVRSQATARIDLISSYSIANHQLSVVTNISDKVQAFGYVWVNIDSVPGATLSAPHDSLFVGEIPEKVIYTQVFDQLKPGFRYLLRAQGWSHDQVIYGNTLDVFVGDVWQQMKNFTGAGYRWSPIAFTINNSGFVGLGETLEGNQPQFGGTLMKDLWMYDQNKDAWIRMADFPGNGRCWASVFVLDGKAYVGAGRNAGQQFKDFYAYTPPPENKWNRVSDLPITARSATGFSINGKGYLCGGYSNTYIPDTVINMNTLFEFDPTQNGGMGAWRQMVSFPGPPRKNLVSFVLNGKAYVGCGKDGSNDEDINNGQSYNDFYCFDPLAGSLGGWTIIAPLPSGGRYDALAFSIGDYGFAGTGASSPYPTYKDLWRYQPGKGWERKANVGPFNRRSSFAFVADNKAYIGLGLLTTGISTIDNDVWRYTPEK